MANIKSRSLVRQQRHERVRKHVIGIMPRPRLNVFKSITGIYAQIINDEEGNTLAEASSIDKELRPQMKGLTKTQQARLVGLKVAERAKEKGVEKVVFDRGGFTYIGRVKALADGAREGGLEF